MEIEKRIKEAKVNLEWKIALKMKQRANGEAKPPSVVTIRRSPPKTGDEKSPYRRPPGVPSHIISPPKNKSVVRSSIG
jgi:hypothetical protein